MTGEFRVWTPGGVVFTSSHRGEAEYVYDRTVEESRRTDRFAVELQERRSGRGGVRYWATIETAFVARARNAVEQHFGEVTS